MRDPPLLVTASLGGDSLGKESASEHFSIYKWPEIVFMDLFCSQAASLPNLIQSL